MRILFVAATCAFVLCACTAAAGIAEPCRRKLDDAQVEIILARYLDLTIPHRTKIYWQECRYDIVVWPLPVVPDSQILVTLDADGNLIDKKH